ncbi:hypothetical protein [Vibrio europaeus]|uniref:hypothetical protein n=1 Tax=Vibrio europaeus TaxID=300876 RepID=UPI00233F7521|nr:hypothetical protein [Vibrio europaeus]MDC5855929.1 hypothetical protein [Vibrio europaeus]
MKSINIFLLFLLSLPAVADDAESNPLAQKLKVIIQKQISNKDLHGYCDLFIEMIHQDSVAIVKRVSSTGDYQLCKSSIKSLRIGQRFTYVVPEKYIRLHIEN